jgi:hypothetical protein
LLARFIILRATPPVLNTLPRILKLDREKSKHAGLTQQNGFTSAKKLHGLLLMAKGTAKPNAYQKRV